MILGAVVGITAVIVLGQLVSRQLRLDDVEQAVLPSLGYTRNQVLADGLGRAAVVAVLGGVGAGAIAFVASDRFPVGFVARVEPTPGRRFDVLSHVLGPLVLVIAVLAWMLGSMVLERSRSKVAGGPTVTDRLVPAVPNPKATTALHFAFGAPSGGRRSGRASLVALAVVFGVMAGALSFGINLDRLIDQPARWGNNFDVGLGEGESEIAAPVRDQLMADADVESVTLYGETSASVQSSSLDIIGMQLLKGHLVPDVLRGRLPQSDDEIALGSVAAGDLGKDVGDDVDLSAATGPRTVRVVGISVNPSVAGADKVGRSGLVTAGALAALDPAATMNSAGVKVRPGVSDPAARVGAIIGQPVGPFTPPSAILNLDRVRTIPFVIAAAVGFLAVVSLAHLMIVAVQRRRRELATLRAFGAPRRWISAVVHWQATLITVVVLVVALPIGSIAGSALCRAFMEGVGARPETVQPAVWLAGALAALIVTANVVAAVPARRARRIAPARVLRDE